jgi:hypothetical protein
MTVSRHDSEQSLYAIDVTTPPGIAATLGSVPKCEEPLVARMECSSQSAIGHVHVAAGVGSSPYWVEGVVYLTGPYDGAPFGFLVVVPAKAGPFNLGNVAVRAAVRVNPYNAAATVESAPLPQMVDGVPLRVQTVEVTLDRANFMIDPTNCSQLAISGSITGGTPSGASASTAPVASNYAATGCKGLGFAPSFSATTVAKTSKKLGADLKIKIAYPAGREANLSKVDVEVPKVLPVQDKTLNEACTEAQFNANPAGCPPRSDVAHVVVHTPVLAAPLAGPAYLVSHGGAAFPDLELVLQGEGVELIVDGKTQIKHGVTYSHFETVPDAPISSFEFDAPQGEYALLAAYGNLCRKKLVMPTRMTAQNGAVITVNTRVSVTGCPSRIAVTSSKVSGRTETVSVYVPAAGKLSASGAGVASSSKTATGTELISFKLRQKVAGRRSIKLKLSFQPAKGRRQSKTVLLHFVK